MNAMTATTRTHLYDIDEPVNIRGFDFTIRVYDVEIVEGTYSYNAPSDIDYYGYENVEWTLCVEGVNDQGQPTTVEVPEITGSLTGDEWERINSLAITDAHARRRKQREEYEAEQAAYAEEDARFGAFDDVPW